MTGFQDSHGPPPQGPRAAAGDVGPGTSALAPAAVAQRRDAAVVTGQAPGDDRAWAEPRAAPPGRDAFSLISPAHPRELHRPLDLQRALRPLLRTIPGGPATCLDEEATATCSAEARAVIPVLTRASERWLNMILVVDASPSMMLWGNLVSELELLLTQLGAFRTIRTWNFRFGGDTAAISPRLTRTLRAPREILDPAGRQTFLVISDCASEPWQSGAAMRAVETWARTGPLAIVQPLFQHLWSRSAPKCHYLRLHSPYPGAPNDQLIADAAGDDKATSGSSGIPIPILELGPAWLAAWSQLISSTDRSHALAAFTRDRAPGTETASDVKRDTDAQQIVADFMAGASPEAFHLAGLLAAAPQSLPIHLMRLIQQRMLPGTPAQQLAEIYLGGLMRFLPVPAGREGNPATPTLEFLDGVRDVLLRTVRRSDAIEVVELVAGALARSRATADAAALLGVDLGPAGQQLTAGDQQYPDIEAQVLRRIGGRYAQVAASSAVPEDEQVTAAGAPPRAGAGRPSAAQPGDGQRVEQGITLLGTPSSGKSTFLAALAIALLRQSGPGADPGGSWRVVGVDKADVAALTQLTRTLGTDRAFPQATVGVERYRWELLGTIPRAARAGRFGRFRREWRRESVAIPLDLADAPGEAANPATAGPARWESLIDNLERSKGIVFLFDPVREFRTGDAFTHTLAVVNELSQRMRDRRLPGGRLPHHVAVCVTKFDEVPVFETAERLGLIEYDSDGPGFPRVPDDEAREFFVSLCGISRSGDADLVLSLLEQTFRPERIRYFASSAIGFYVNPRTGRFDRRDYQNHVPGPAGTGPARVRGRVYPINVIEPVLWLGQRLIQ